MLISVTYVCMNYGPDQNVKCISYFESGQKGLKATESLIGQMGRG